MTSDDILMFSVVNGVVIEDDKDNSNIESHRPSTDHDYSIKVIKIEDLPFLKPISTSTTSSSAAAASKSSSSSSSSSSTKTNKNYVVKTFAKCDQCRRSRSKVQVPDSLLSITLGKNDGVTCDFCGNRMQRVQPQTLPNVFEGRRGSKGGGGVVRRVGTHNNNNNDNNNDDDNDDDDDEEDEEEEFERPKRQKNYVYCGECGKIVLKESLTKHHRDVHEKSNKRQCGICHKLLSGSFSLKEHISAVHNKTSKHKCIQCQKTFAHFSNMNRHIRLVHDKMVVSHKYVNCPTCNKVVQSTSLKKHMLAIHEMRKDFECQHCNKRFAQSYTLKEHIAAKHTKRFNHVCRLCNKAFAHKTNCGRHLKTVHKDDVEIEHATEGDLVSKYIISTPEEIIE